MYAWICVSGLHDLLCYGFVEVFESQLLTETFRGSAQARPKQALRVTSIIMVRPSREIYAQHGSMDISAKYSIAHSHAWATHRIYAVLI